jgi:2,4-dienoyl-CoA reductase-like NADH-dependent reductase (Old Yellow Enzyme family)
MFDRCFAPLRIGGVQVANRLFVTAHHTAFVTDVREDGSESSFLDGRAVDYVEERAKGGFGLLIVGQTQVHPRSGRHRPAAYGSRAAAMFGAMADRCHRHGSRVFVQLNQNGSEQIWTGPDNWEPAWGPSATATLDPNSRGEMCKEMDLAEIDALIEAFASAAASVAAVGVDGVEIHAAHPHLLGQWLVPAYNKRTDDYGGSLDNRLRLVLRVIDAVRGACPRPFTVGLRINGAWSMPGGQTLEQGVAIAVTAAETGQLDFLDVSGWPGIGTIGSPLGALLPSAAAVRQAVRAQGSGLPVFGVGRVIDPSHAETALRAGQADMIGMTRASIADPFLPAKARSGRADDIRRCVGAGQGCLMRNAGGRPITCTQNPAVGRERMWGEGSLEPTDRPRPVVIVGGGVAGMEAAWVAAARGHSVTLLEASDRLGGQVNLITAVARRREMGEVVAWRARTLAKLGVDVRLNSPATFDGLLSLLPPEAVAVIATGSRPRRVGWYAATPHLPAIPGSDAPFVFTVWDVLQGRLEGRERVAVVDGCTYYQSSDPVEYLATRGVQVEAIATTASFAEGLERNDRPAFVAVAGDAGVRFHVGKIVTRVEAGRVVMRDTFTGDVESIDGLDAVVLSIGNDVVDRLYHELVAAGREAHRAGDCLTPRGIEHALFEAHRLARVL